MACVSLGKSLAQDPFAHAEARLTLDQSAFSVRHLLAESVYHQAIAVAQPQAALARTQVGSYWLQ